LKRMALWVLLLALIGWSAWQFSQPAVAPQAHMPLKVLDIGKVHTMMLEPASEITVQLEKQNRNWMLAGQSVVPANDESVQRLLNDLASMHVIRVVTHTHAHDHTLGMDTGVKLVLRDQTGTALLTLIVGKQGSDLISTYVRIGQAPEVFAVDQALVWQVRRDSNSWKAFR